MIDPSDITKYDRTEAELQEFWLFCILAAGKPAFRMARLLDGMLTTLRGDMPFDKFGQLEYWELRGLLQMWRIGQYRRISEAFQQTFERKPNLFTCSVEDLESIYGVGPKTARFFIVHSRPGQRYAVLDTHVLKHLASLGYKVPKSTPTGANYRRLEKIVLALADGAKMTPADFDLSIWNSYARAA